MKEEVDLVLSNPFLTEVDTNRVGCIKTEIGVSSIYLFAIKQIKFLWQ
jgi:hypothetical protein